MTTVRINPTDSFNYEATSNPLVTTNPPCIPVTWFNSMAGEVFVCIDNTPDSNVWVGQCGTEVP